jgi:Kef-type K+ transport system membrane component KefB
MTLQLPPWWKVVAFTVNLLCGLILSQVLGAFLDKHAFKATAEVVHIFTMWALSFIMVNVGYEFTIDKKDLAQYVWDYLIAMTAAGFPWLFVAVWFMICIDGLPADQAFLVARFAAPTSAGILFSMLEGAGLRDTWVFSKARVLAIFDDLDTILLMIPLKIVMIGFKWELMVVICIMVILLAFAWRYLHRLQLPYSSAWSLVYAAVVTACCYGLYKVTKYHLPMEALHIEVLLPAFVVGCMIDTPCARHELTLQRQATMERKETKRLQSLALSGASPPQCQQADSLRRAGAGADETGADLAFPHRTVSGDSGLPQRVVSGGWVKDETGSAELGEGKLGVPGGKDGSKDGSSEPGSKDVVRRSKQSTGSRLSRHGHEKDETHPHESEWEHNVQTSISMVFMVLVGLSMPPLLGKNAKGDSDMTAGMIAAHVLMVSLLMVLGKMFPIVCYRDEASWKERLALCMGMCPRGEVGASIIVISLELGVKGPAVIISMCALVINLVLSGGFIGSVKFLLKQVNKVASQTSEGAADTAAADAAPQAKSAEPEAAATAVTMFEPCEEPPVGPAVDVKVQDF